MDKEKMIKSLEQVIRNLKGESDVGRKYEIRYWDNEGEFDKRSDGPSSTCDGRAEAEEIVMCRIYNWDHVEMTDSKTGKIHMEFHRYKDGK